MDLQVIEPTRSVGRKANLILVSQVPANEAIGSDEFVVTPPAKVRRLSATVLSAGKLPDGSQGLRVVAYGQLAAPDPLYWEFWQTETTPLMIAAEAWKHYSAEALKPAFLRPKLIRKYANAAQVFDQVVGNWACLEDLPASSSTKKLPHLQQHSFDVYVAAFCRFRDQPETLEFQAGAPHAAAVLAMEAWFSQVFGEQVDSTDGMNKQQLAGLFEEVLAAEKLRKKRNSSAGHPFETRDHEVRQQSYRLFQQMVSVDHYTITHMQTLAKAALPYLADKLDAMDRAEQQKQQERRQLLHPQPNLLSKYFAR